MTTTTEKNGRLCNQIIRNLAVSLIAEKYDLYVDYSNKCLIENIGIDLYCGQYRHPTTKPLTDANYMEIYLESLMENLDPNNHFFQTKEIIQVIYDHLHSTRVMQNIIRVNPYKERYRKNNDLFVHIRLTDVEYLNPGIDYYMTAIADISFDTLYIASDNTAHSMIKEIVGRFPNSQIIDYDETDTIHFGSTCKTVVLSHGTFSSVIGYLSFYSTVYYPHKDRAPIIWHGDIFSIEGWIAL
jgi:hypothetical protein